MRGARIPATRPHRVRPHDCWRAAAAALAFHVLYLAVLLAGSRGDATVFLCVGDGVPLPAEAGEPARFEGQPGYDGQFTALVALDPLDRRETSRFLDDPGKRFARILLPGLARLAGANDLSSAAWILAAANALAAAAVAAAACALAPPGIWRVAAAIAAAVQPGLAVAVSRCTPGPLGLALCLGAFWLRRRGRLALAGACFALAALDQEIFATIPVALAAEGLLRRRSSSLAWLLSLGPTAIWRLSLAVQGMPGAIPTGDLGVPLGGILDGIAGAIPPRGFLPEEIYEILHALSFVLLALSILRRSAAVPGACLAALWLAAASADRDVWVAFWSAARATAPAFALAAVRGDLPGRIAVGGAALFSPLLPIWFALYPPQLVGP